MKRLLLVFALVLLSTAVWAANQSTINPLLPVQNTPLTSAPVRNNFQAAYNDINNIYSLLPSSIGTITTITCNPTSPFICSTTPSGSSVQINVGGTFQGNGSKIQLSTGTTTTNHCVKFDSNGNTVDSGSACGSGGGGTPGGSSGQIQYNSAGSFGGFTASGDATINTSTGAVTVGKVNGVTYGTSPSTNTVPVVTGSNTITYETVPNAALANSSTTVAGQSCALGGSCSIGVGNLSSIGAYSLVSNNTNASAAPSANQTIYLGSPSFTATSGTVLGQLTGTQNNYLQFALQNLSSGSSASTDFVATANDGNDSTHYADFGINGSTGGTAPFTAAHAAFAYSSDNEFDIGALGTTGVVNIAVGATPTTEIAVGTTSVAVNEAMSVSGNLTTNVTGSTQCLHVNSSGVVSGTGSDCGAGGGGVSSLTGDGTIFNNSSSTGAVTLTKATQTANTVLAGPTSGSAATPTFRALTNADMPKVQAEETAAFVKTFQKDGLQVPDQSFLPGIVPRTTKQNTFVAKQTFYAPSGIGAYFRTDVASLIPVTVDSYGTYPNANAGIQFQTRGSNTGSFYATDYGSPHMEMTSLNNVDISPSLVVYPTGGQFACGSSDSGKLTVTDNQCNAEFTVVSTQNAASHLSITGATTGNPSYPAISSLGTDTNSGINLVTKGTGKVQINGSSLPTAQFISAATAATMMAGFGGL